MPPDQELTAEQQKQFNTHFCDLLLWIINTLTLDAIKKAIAIDSFKETLIKNLLADTIDISKIVDGAKIVALISYTPKNYLDNFLKNTITQLTLKQINEMLILKDLSEVIIINLNNLKKLFEKLPNEFYNFEQNYLIIMASTSTKQEALTFWKQQLETEANNYKNIADTLKTNDECKQFFFICLIYLLKINCLTDAVNNKINKILKTYEAKYNSEKKIWIHEQKIFASELAEMIINDLLYKLFYSCPVLTEDDQRQLKKIINEPLRIEIICKLEKSLEELQPLWKNNILLSLLDVSNKQNYEKLWTTLKAKQVIALNLDIKTRGNVIYNLFNNLIVSPQKQPQLHCGVMTALLSYTDVANSTTLNEQLKNFRTNSKNYYNIYVWILTQLSSAEIEILNTEILITLVGQLASTAFNNNLITTCLITPVEKNNMCTVEKINEEDASSRIETNCQKLRELLTYKKLKVFNL